MSLLVPVFTAAQKRGASGLSRPKVMLRDSRSARISVTMWAAAGSSTR